MSLSAAAARLARLAIYSSNARPRRHRLTIEPLEDRAVPANEMTIVAAGDSASIDVKTTGQTTTISAKEPGATLSLATIQDALADASPNLRNVVITTEVPNTGTDGG